MKVEINDWKQLFQISASHSPLPISLPTIALANPPYCQINSAANQELSRFEMAYKWKEQENGSYIITSKLRNKIEQECLFVEQCLKQVQPGEIVCVLLSNGILSSSQHAYFRRWLLEEMAVLIASIQLPPENFQVECELGIVTSFLILKRKGGNLSVPEDYPIFMAVADKIGFDSRGRRLFRPITKEQAKREIDSDLPIIVEEFKQFIKEEIIP
ncbi:N-6 DNA methylase [Anabaena sphaerica FACHB-251]|uniref:N-6 DNA methylase n=1 Tax=Anabaena sphaerica FACHB-251 TaxID=2692883 RepID=A0A926WIR1_9NOST|nr:N-6 DNA methylase [Anabaena sphaerica]MBD2295182.1 N-6 DNA methylase [Anabaena sphaerica FACHB-251]